jgi:hypothetical protein
MIRSIEGFTFTSALDLNMGTIYYHIKLDADAQKLCTIAPKGIKIVPDIFQNIMSKLVQDMDYVKTIMLF